MFPGLSFYLCSEAAIFSYCLPRLSHFCLRGFSFILFPVMMVLISFLLSAGVPLSSLFLALEPTLPKELRLFVSMLRGYSSLVLRVEFSSVCVRLFV